jgi:F-type H+-transporting ATPase subunit epsilon
MADRLTLEVATPTRLMVSEVVDEVVAPGTLGYFGVLPGHAPFLSTLGIGELTYRQGREEHSLAIAGGFAEVRNDKVIVLADSAEFADEIDRQRAERARGRADQRLGGRGQDAEIDYERAGRALSRAQSRLAVSGRARR